MSDVTYTSSELLKWLWRDYLKKHMWLLLLAVIFMSIEGATLGALAKLMQAQKEAKRGEHKPLPTVYP